MRPGPHRDARYAANPHYAKALVTQVIPTLAQQVATSGKPVLMGQSLGALAALYAARRYPGSFAGLFLQSGSFFTPELDPQEATVAEAVPGFESTSWGGVLAPAGTPAPIVASLHAALG